jgi:hypothetical protein
MPPEIQLGRALYYPNFSPDPKWLKCSLLYWDQVYRIVPDEVKEDVFKRDPSDCKIAREEGRRTTKTERVSSFATSLNRSSTQRNATTGGGSHV